MPGERHFSNRSSWLAWALCGLVCLFALANFVGRAISLPAGESIFQLASDLAWIVLPVVFAVVAALITSRQPRNLIGWLLVAQSIFFVLIAPVDAYLGKFTAAPPPTIPNLLITWFSNWSWVLLVLPLALILLLFPTGRPPSPRWRWVLFYALGMFVYFILLATFVENIHEVNDAWMIPNPIGLIPDHPAFLATLVTPWIVSLGVLIIVCAVALFVRYRRAPTVERLQIKWLLFAGAVFVVVYVPLLPWQGNMQSLAGVIADLFFALSITLFPIAIAIAILRHRLWDIDVIIRKTLTYSVLTALLALIFFGSVVLLQQALGSIAGTETSPIGIVLSTLAIAALFTPLRRQVQNTIDRRFYRKNYDAHKILERFAATTRYEVEVEQLIQHLMSVSEETLQPESLSLWLITPRYTPRRPPASPSVHP